MSHPSFQSPKRVKITARSSSITNSFVQSLIPVLHPSFEEVEEALSILGIEPGHPTCAYCGDQTTEWDHLHPLVKDRKPTGFISEIGNLVPACGKCNQSKGNKVWREWMLGSARLSPASRRIPDLAERVRALSAFEHWRTPEPLDLESLVGRELWQEYWTQRDQLLDQMDSCQRLAEQLRERVLERIIA